MSDPVVIVGGGVTGLLLAGELRLAGVPAVVLETRTGIAEHSNGMALHGRSLEFLRQRGLADEIAAAGVFPWPRTPFAFLWLDLAGADERDHTYAFPQWRLEKILERRAVDLGAELRRGHTVVALDNGPDRVTLTVLADGAEYRVEAGYVVGCDGEDSVVRRLSGIPFDDGGIDSGYYGVLGDVAFPDGVYPEFAAGLHPNGMFGALPLQAGMLRLMTIQFDTKRPGDDVPVTADELRAAIRRVTGTDPDIGEVRWLSRFGGATRVAETYRRDRVFLAGDAAHVLYISGTQSLNLGIQDAANLGWKLAAAVKGWAPADLLDTYHMERHVAGEQARTHALAQFALMHPLDRVGPLRDIMSDILGFGDVNQHLLKLATAARYPTMGQEGHRPVGEQIGELPLSTPGGETSVAALLAGGRGVLVDFSGGTVGDEARAWSEWVEIVEARPVAEFGGDGVLVRPDGYVAWLGGEGLLDALRMWFGDVWV
ncbi:MAG TPA: FAD-dependent monooxygenase [Actinophytocola sp.]|jgi:2-polyprenyl-6-methoxyphenol hydroxylase-like FAD-dependent oxidoreductase|uniref:FAD-dependent monooxygenase n=1 Tax=Actinophytocola sp. TaxID=1872138 RepID=UPI002DFBB541|nr:FAD-dependent monooxygenase [Actinophytocola sp.]